MNFVNQGAEKPDWRKKLKKLTEKLEKSEKPEKLTEKLDKREDVYPVWLIAKLFVFIVIE